MARFYATMQGNRGEASRIGTPNSGIYAHVRGWRVGARVNCYADGDNDGVSIRATGGSTGHISDFPIANLKRANGAITVTLYGKGGKAMRPFTVQS